MIRKFIARLLHRVHLIRRSHTLGVRAAVFDDEGRVFLVRHTYVSGWYLPGGGVERGQTFEEALTMELREEGNITLTGPVRLIGIYLNENFSNRDHVACYECRAFTQNLPLPFPNHEIAEAGFFKLDNLPKGTTAGTLRRLDELQGRAEISAYW